MKALVSIIIPAYNAEEWIADTVQSAIAQTWPAKEIIIVDDGSRDRTAEIARRFASKEVLVVSKENQGAAAARNHALTCSAKGTISSGWMRMICWRRTRSSGNLRRCGRLTTGDYFYPRRGRISTIGPTAPASSRRRCGKTFPPSSGS